MERAVPCTRCCVAGPEKNTKKITHLVNFSKGEKRGKMRKKGLTKGERRSMICELLRKKRKTRRTDCPELQTFSDKKEKKFLTERIERVKINEFSAEASRADETAE